MKVLHMISSGGMYGAEAVILNLSRTLNEASHCSTLGVFSNSSHPNVQLHASAAKEGIESHLVPCKGQMDRTVTAKIRELAAQTQADVVHAHGYKADVYAYLALRGSDMPLVSTCHNWIDDSQLVYCYGVVDRMVLRKYAAAVAVSEDVKRRLLRAGVKAGNIHIVRNGIDLGPYEHAPPTLREDFASEDAPIVGLIGRLSKEKGVDIFLRAAARVLIEFPGTKFVVVGDGPDRAELESLIDELKIRNSIAMLGRRDDMPSVYASLDVMVSSSRKEGLPMSILEGMASRRPLVATAVGEVPTVVQDGRTGLLIPAENVAALATAIAELLRNSALRERLGISARELVEAEFSAARMAADYLNVYRTAVER
ncbi:MAG: glycosyltransferase family 4 protein [Acidobacteriaceae bacterium]